MSKSKYNDIFNVKESEFNGYFSHKKITDIDNNYIATTITVDDLTKTSRQLKTSMGQMTKMLDIFGVLMSLLIIYLLSKIVIEKNAQSISMTKILGFNNKEISNMYILTTSIVVIGSIIITIPLCSLIMKKIIPLAMADYSGWLPYYVPTTSYFNMALISIVSYLLVVYLQTKKVKKIPLADALKKVE